MLTVNEVAGLSPEARRRLAAFLLDRAVAELAEVRIGLHAAKLAAHVDAVWAAADAGTELARVPREELDGLRHDPFGELVARMCTNIGLPDCPPAQVAHLSHLLDHLANARSEATESLRGLLVAALDKLRAGANRAAL